MRKSSIILISACIVLSACSQNDMLPEPAGETIRFSATVADDATKALLEDDDIQTNGTVVKICGYAGGNVLSDGGSPATTMSNLSLTCGSDGKWTLPKTFKWQYNTDHQFYGWLDTDAKSGLTASGFFNSGFAYSDTDKKITISAKTLGVSDSYLDFVYSDVVTRSTSMADYSTVVLPMRHLFTSFSLAAHNYTTSSITISSVKLYGIHNNKGAVVTFGSTGTSVEYTGGTTVLGTTSAPYEELLSASVTLAANAHKTNIAKGASDNIKYFLMWPQTATELTASVTSSDPFTPTGTNQPYLEITYKQGSGDPITVKAAIPYGEDGGWEAGVRHNLELSFKDKLMTLNFSAKPWNLTEPAIDYEGTVMVHTPGEEFIDASSCIIDNVNHRVYFKGGNPIIMKFKIDQPLNATWIVGKDGDFDAFEIDNITPDTGEGIVGDGYDENEGLIDAKYATIAISPKITAPQKDYLMQLSFVVLGNNGVVTNIDEQLQGTDHNQWYTFVLLK